jgi:RNA-splicing ligase RtcB
VRSDGAKKRQRREMGTLGSGNHYLEIQAVAEIYDEAVAKAFGLAQVAEEATSAYKYVGAVAAATERAGLAIAASHA